MQILILSFSVMSEKKIMSADYILPCMDILSKYTARFFRHELTKIDLATSLNETFGTVSLKRITSFPSSRVLEDRFSLSYSNLHNHLPKLRHILFK